MLFLLLQYIFSKFRLYLQQLTILSQNACFMTSPEIHLSYVPFLSKLFKFFQKITIFFLTNPIWIGIIYKWLAIRSQTYIGDWSNGMIGVSKTFGGSSILSSPAINRSEMLDNIAFPAFLFFFMSWLVYNKRKGRNEETKKWQRKSHII